MKKYATIVMLIILGMLFGVKLNTTDISKLSLGVELPIGWQEPTEYIGAICDMMARPDEGIPFSYTRSSHSCQSDTNTLAQALNIVIGGTAGGAVGYIITKKKFKKS